MPDKSQIVWSFALSLWAIRIERVQTPVSVRVWLRNTVIRLSDAVVKNFIRIRFSRTLEYVSAWLLLAILAGKIVVLQLDDATDDYITAFLAGVLAVAGFLQLRAVRNGTIDERITANSCAIVAWLLLVVVLAMFYMPLHVYVAVIVIHHVIPVGFVMLVTSLLQMLVLLREQVSPSISPEERFAYAVFDRFEKVLKIDGRTKMEIIKLVEAVATELNIRR